MRELQLWADEEEVGSAFPEIEALAEGWRKLAKEAAFLRTKEEWAARESDRSFAKEAARTRNGSR